jgi:hypothetical protein
LDHKLNNIWRLSVRPRLLGVDHNVLNLDLAWEFRNAGLQDVQVNGHLALVSPGDDRLSVEEGAAYALARHQTEVDGIERMRREHGDRLAKDGFSHTEFDELIELKRARIDYIRDNHARVRQVMEVFPEPLLIVRGRKASRARSRPVSLEAGEHEHCTKHYRKMS